MVDYNCLWWLNLMEMYHVHVMLMKTLQTSNRSSNLICGKLQLSLLLLSWLKKTTLNKTPNDMSVPNLT